MSDQEVRLKCLELAINYSTRYAGGLKVADLSEVCLQFEKLVADKTFDKSYLK